MEAADVLSMSDRSLRRWRYRYQKHGYDGLYDRRKGKPSPRRVPVETVEEVLRLYRERYDDFNVRLSVANAPSHHRIRGLRFGRQRPEARRFGPPL